MALRKNHHHVTYHDLYNECFDPILPGPEIPRDTMLTEKVELHCKEVAEADGFIIVHPNW